MALFLLLFLIGVPDLSAGELIVEMEGGDADITLLGAVARWDSDGLPAKADGTPLSIDPKASLAEPYVDARAIRLQPGCWKFENLRPNTYDLIIIQAKKKRRLEGFRFAPVRDFDPFLPPDAGVFHDREENGMPREKVADMESYAWVVGAIEKAPHYENKAAALWLGGDYTKGRDRPKFVRSLVLLLRDEKTSFDAAMPGAATLRFEIWQFDHQGGTFVKNRKTQVLHRVLVPRKELAEWSWLWEPALGDIIVSSGTSRTVRYDLQASPNQRGLKPTLVPGK